LFIKINFKNNIKAADIWSVNYTILVARPEKSMAFGRQERGNEDVFSKLLWNPLNQLAQNGVKCLFLWNTAGHF